MVDQMTLPTHTLPPVLLRPDGHRLTVERVRPVHARPLHGLPTAGPGARTQLAACRGPGRTCRGVGQAEQHREPLPTAWGLQHRGELFEGPGHFVLGAVAKGVGEVDAVVGVEVQVLAGGKDERLTLTRVVGVSCSIGMAVLFRGRFCPDHRQRRLAK